VIGDHDGRAELTECAQPRQQHPGEHRRPRDGECDPKEQLERSASESRPNPFEHRIDRGKGRSCCDDEKRRRDEHLGQNDSGEGICQGTPRGTPERTAVAHEEQQKDATCQRWQGAGQLNEKSDYGRQAPLRASEQVAERDPAEGDEDRGD
jgi:hypothetical protein